jgi:hypothetical protein
MDADSHGCNWDYWSLIPFLLATFNNIEEYQRLLASISGSLEGHVARRAQR